MNQQINEKEPNGIFKDEKFANKVIMDFRTTSACKFKRQIGPKQYDIILTKE